MRSCSRARAPRWCAVSAALASDPEPGTLRLGVFVDAGQVYGANQQVDLSQLRALQAGGDLTYFSQVRSCGTSTQTSLPNSATAPPESHSDSGVAPTVIRSFTAIAIVSCAMLS